jgi:hypothetical protein
LSYGLIALAALTVFVFAGIGVASLFEDEKPSYRELLREASEATDPDLGSATEVARIQAERRRRSGEEIRERRCEVTSEVPPFRYRCQITYRNSEGRYRGIDLRLARSLRGPFFQVVSVRPRNAGPGAP